MNPTSKKPPGARGIPQPFKQPTGRAPQFKPPVAQLKNAVSAQSVKRPVAPPVYRPHTKPVAAQAKMAVAAQMKTHPVAPPAYRPQPLPRVLQKKTSLPGNCAVAPSACRAHLPKALPAKPLNPPATSSKSTSRAFGRTVRPTSRWAGTIVQRSSPAPTKASNSDSKEKSKLSDIAEAIHKGAAGSSQNTTGLARLKNGKLVVATQLSVETVKSQVEFFGIAKGDVMATLGSGFHVEVTLYITYGSDISAIGASQGFCPHCQQFLTAKGITMEGLPRKTADQVWYSPEYYGKKEKDPKNASYPWAYFKDPVDQIRVTFETMEDFEADYKKKTGEDWLKK